MGCGGEYSHVCLKTKQNTLQLIIMHIPTGHLWGFLQLWDPSFLKWVWPWLKGNTQCWQNWKRRLCFPTHFLQSSFLVQFNYSWFWQYLKTCHAFISYLTHLCSKQCIEEILVNQGIIGWFLTLAFFYTSPFST